LPSLGEILKEYRRLNHLNQEDLASRLNISQSYVSKIESGGRVVRDVALLARIKQRLEIPASRLGLSDELIDAVDHRVRRGVGEPVLPVQGGSAAVVASQDEWRRIRRHFNEHRADLASAAVRLYGPQHQLGLTPLIMRPDWIPRAPVDLADVALIWNADALPAAVTGAEPEARMVCPLRAPGRQYDRYTSTVRYLDRPTLFENRPSYRLLDVTWAPGGGAMTFGLATYFDKLDVSEAVGHELARLHAQSKVFQPSWERLPFRALIGDPFDFHRRVIVPAITTLTLRRRRQGRGASFLLHWRDATKVATAGGMYDVIPAGEFQPSSVMACDQANDFDIWRNIVRELSEEFLGSPEHDGSRSTPIDYNAWPLYRSLSEARDQGAVYAACLGLGLDALTLAGTILTVLVVDDDAFDGLFGEVVRVNAEGSFVTAAANQSVAEGIPFTAQNVHRLLTHEPMASPGAACLYLAWKHRDRLLGG
jgi:transcriptional regulator with XRE-family HTH domain